MDQTQQIPDSSQYYVRGAKDIENIVRYYYPPRMADDSEDHDYGDSSDSTDFLGYQTSQELFKKLLTTLWKHAGPFTVICEDYHVDPMYRDSYYSYFSNQHFTMSRFTKRLTFFKNQWKLKEIIVPENAEKLNSNFLGTCVICPTDARTLGRTLLAPAFMLDSGPCYLRLANYSITVFGVRLNVKAFLFQMQDRETTRCAEVTLLNILDYFGNSYSDYRTYHPSEIIRAEQAFSPDRTLPSRGINYFTMSKLLTKFGFSPRLYGKEAISYGDAPFSEAKGKSEDWSAIEMRRLLHYYVESGIPVATNVMWTDSKQMPGHSLVCIGYSGEQNASRAHELSASIGGGRKFINSADYYWKYVVIDDNQIPYAVREFRELSCHQGMTVEYILVPLYKRMFLEATDAYDVVTSILVDPKFGLKSRASKLPEDEPVVIRLFLASSRTFKNFRIMNSRAQSNSYRFVYGTTPLPRFIWVAELYRVSDYETENPQEAAAFGEIILDATSATKNDIKSVIMLNYPDAVSIRGPDDSIDALNRCVNGLSLKPFRKFTGNLQEITPQWPQESSDGEMLESGENSRLT